VVALSRGAIQHAVSRAPLALAVDPQVEIEIHMARELEDSPAGRAHTDLAPAWSGLRFRDSPRRLVLLPSHRGSSRESTELFVEQPHSLLALGQLGPFVVHD
jgi:hypothetical protein